jgi:hypothetical protein
MRGDPIDFADNQLPFIGPVVAFRTVIANVARNIHMGKSYFYHDAKSVVWQYGISL